jgi:hypothetical protein
LVVVAVRAWARVTDTAKLAVTEPAPPASVSWRVMDEPAVAGNWLRPEADCGEFAVVTTVVVTPAHTFRVVFHARVQLLTDTVPVPLVMLTLYVEPTRLRSPLFVIVTYCGADKPPVANVKDVADGVARHVPEVMVVDLMPCALFVANAGMTVPMDALRRTAAIATALLSCVNPRRTRQS